MDCLESARWLHVRQRRDSLIWYIVPQLSLARPVWDKFFELAPRGWISDFWGSRQAPGGLRVGRCRIEFKSAMNPAALVAVGLDKVYIDEAGTIKREVWNESIRPALMDQRAPAVIYGTPKGKLHWFYELAVRGDDPGEPDYARFGGPSWQNPWIDLDEIRAMRREMYRDLYRQEVLAVFLEGEGTVFRNIAALRDRAVELFGGRGYCDHPARWIGVDLARAVDFTVLFGLCAEHHAARVTDEGYDRFNQLSWAIQRDRIKGALHRARARDPEARLVVDASGVGDETVDTLDLELPEGTVEGVQTGANKRELIEGYARTLDTGEILLPDERVLINEHEAFTYEITRARNIRYSAPEGLHDDTVIACALADHGRRHHRQVVFR